MMNAWKRRGRAVAVAVATSNGVRNASAAETALLIRRSFASQESTTELGDEASALRFGFGWNNGTDYKIPFGFYSIDVKVILKPEDRPALLTSRLRMRTRLLHKDIASIKLLDEQLVAAVKLLNEKRRLSPLKQYDLDQSVMEKVGTTWMRFEEVSVAFNRDIMILQRTLQMTTFWGVDEFDAAWNSLNAFVYPRAWHYNCKIENRLNFKPEECRSCVDEMFLTGTMPDICSYSLLLQSYIVTRNWDAIPAMLVEMASVHVQFDRDFFSHLIGCIARNGLLTESEEITRMAPHDIIALDQMEELLHLYACFCKKESGDELISRLMAKHMSRHSMYAVAAVYFVATGRREDAMKIAQLKPSLGIQSSIPTERSIRRILMRESRMLIRSLDAAIENNNAEFVHGMLDLFELYSNDEVHRRKTALFSRIKRIPGLLEKGYIDVALVLCQRILPSLGVKQFEHLSRSFIDWYAELHLLKKRLPRPPVENNLLEAEAADIGIESDSSPIDESSSRSSRPFIESWADALCELIRAIQTAVPKRHLEDFVNVLITTRSDENLEIVSAVLKMMPTLKIALRRDAFSYLKTVYCLNGKSEEIEELLSIQILSSTEEQDSWSNGDAFRTLRQQKARVRLDAAMRTKDVHSISQALLTLPSATLSEVLDYEEMRMCLYVGTVSGATSIASAAADHILNQKEISGRHLHAVDYVMLVRLACMKGVPADALRILQLMETAAEVDDSYTPTDDLIEFVLNALIANAQVAMAHEFICKCAAERRYLPIVINLRMAALTATTQQYVAFLCSELLVVLILSSERSTMTDFYLTAFYEKMLGDSVEQHDLAVVTPIINDVLRILGNSGRFKTAQRLFEFSVKSNFDDARTHNLYLTLLPLSPEPNAIAQHVHAMDRNQLPLDPDGFQTLLVHIAGQARFDELEAAFKSRRRPGLVRMKLIDALVAQYDEHKQLGRLLTFAKTLPHSENILFDRAADSLQDSSSSSKRFRGYSRF